MVLGSVQDCCGNVHVHVFVTESNEQPANGKGVDPCGSAIIELPEPVVKTTLIAELRVKLRLV